LKTFFPTFFVFFAAASFTVFAADRKFDRNDISSVREYAEQGDPVAQYYLAQSYEYDEKMKEAAEWYQKAAEQGDLDAQYKLATCYENGRGVEQDIFEALRWYAKAARGGIVEAQFNLGFCFEAGTDIEKNIKEAVKWYQMAAEQKNTEAQYRLGFCFENYEEVQNDDKAANWYRKAAERGNERAQYRVALFYETGRGLEENKIEAIRWYTKAATQGNMDAQFRLGQYYESGTEGVPRDIQTAAKWYTKAAELGSAKAQAKMEQLAEELQAIEAALKLAEEQRKKEEAAPVAKGNDAAQKNTTELVITPNGITNIRLSRDLSLEMVKIAAGDFEQSANDGENYFSEVAHQATLTKDFFLGKTEVTQAQWKAVMGTNPSYFKGDDLPVEKVSWNDAMSFCERLNAVGRAPNGWRFTLPTETQWEYAARGGRKNKGYKYSGSNNIDEVAWYTSNSDSKTHPVGKKAANELGLYDMSGNVWEWCLDNWLDKSDRLTAEFSRDNDPDSSHRVLRGGGWFNYARYCRSSDRYGNAPGLRSSNLGFRLALVPIQ